MSSTMMPNTLAISRCRTRKVRLESCTEMVMPGFMSMTRLLP